MFLSGICIIILLACSGKREKITTLSDSQLFENQNNKENTVSDTLILEGQKTKQTSELTATEEVVDMPYATASLVNWKEYFRKNNKYKDRDPKNSKRVIVQAIVEKDGSTTDVKILRECDEDLLNKEAFRLIQDAKAIGAQIEPGKDAYGNPVRSKWTIFVEFPPK